MLEKLEYVVRQNAGEYRVYSVSEERPKEDCFPIEIVEYVPPIAPPVSDWYIASFHSAKHTGLDINLNKSPYGDVELGMPVRATCAGMVVFAEMARSTSWGNLVITVSYGLGGMEYWRYAHLQDIEAHTGQIVVAGDRIGTIGKGYNNRYDAHLHIDTWRDRMIAPESWLTSYITWGNPLDLWPDWNWGTRG